MNSVNTDGCKNDCTIDSAYTCPFTTVAQGIDQCGLACGDGAYDSSKGEQCDDGDTDNLDGCNSSCQRETGWTCTAVAGDTSTCTGICGDNYRVSDETCDDGDDSDGEGCLSDCSGTLSGWTCSGGDETQPDTCSTTCGDGIVVGSEQCDDGNTDDLDGCDSS